MSFKFQVEAITPNHHVLPKMGKMKAEVHAFLSTKLLDQTDEALWQQAAAAAAYEGVTGVYLMPDTHLGYGIPVGGVVVTDNTIIQAGSGYDISCGVVYMQVPGLHAADVAAPARRERWIDEVEARVATGLGNHRPAQAPPVSHTLIEDVLRYGAKALGVSADLCERQYIDIPEGFDSRLIGRARAKAQPQLGSVGGGNHFIEMQVDGDSGEVWVMVHCGSRGYGWQTANHFYYEGARLRGLASKRREESWLYADEALGRRYWAHHNSAANYAVANRHLIVHGVREAPRRCTARTSRSFTRFPTTWFKRRRSSCPTARPSAASSIVREPPGPSPPGTPIWRAPGGPKPGTHASSRGRCSPVPPCSIPWTVPMHRGVPSITGQAA